MWIITAWQCILPEVTVKDFMKCCISSAVDWSDDMLCCGMAVKMEMLGVNMRKTLTVDMESVTLSGKGR